MPAPVFSAGRLPAYGSPAGASEAQRLVHSKELRASGLIPQPCEASSGSCSSHRCGKKNAKIALNVKKRPIEAFFIFRIKKTLSCYLKCIVGQFEKPFFKKELFRMALLKNIVDFLLIVYYVNFVVYRYLLK
jgi:hypothetical protein